MKRRTGPLPLASEACLYLLPWACLTSACAVPHKLITARHTPCKVSEIEIKDVTYAADEETWIAVCGKRSYECSTREQGRRLIYACVKR